MAHEKIFGICENKCLVETDTKESTDAQFSVVNERLETLENGHFNDLTAESVTADNFNGVFNGTLKGNVDGKINVDVALNSTSNNAIGTFGTFTGGGKININTWTPNTVTLNFAEDVNITDKYMKTFASLRVKEINIPVTYTWCAYSNSGSSKGNLVVTQNDEVIYEQILNPNNSTTTYTIELKSLEPATFTYTPTAVGSNSANAINVSTSQIVYTHLV